MTFSNNADIVIMTALPVEFASVRAILSDVEAFKPTKLDPRLYSWTCGSVESTLGKYRVILARIPHAGQIQSSLATLATIRRWSPRYIFFVGVAGGFEKNGARLGGVVLSDVIYGYEYGKIDEKGRFVPRNDLTYRCDGALLTAATDYASQDGWRREISDFESECGCVVGPVASGDKVVDDPDSDFFSVVLDAWPKTIGVEMEGVGAAAAVAESITSGLALSYLMIRGVSDLPDTACVAGTQTRDATKKLASDRAAGFVVGLVQNGLPTPPDHCEKEDSVDTRRGALHDATHLASPIYKAQRYLQNIQNLDGGIPATKPRQGSGCWTTASALEAILLSTACSPVADSFCHRACEFLISQQLRNGGWPLVGGPVASTFATGHALASLILHEKSFSYYQLSEQRASAISAGFEWLQKHELPDGGWGVEPDGSGEGRDFRIAPTFYGLRPYFARGDTIRNSAVVKKAAHLIAEIQDVSGGWAYRSGLACAKEPCPSNTARAISILINSKLCSRTDGRIMTALALIVGQRYGDAWRLTTEGFYEGASHAQNTYHNNTPCDALDVLQLVNAYGAERDRTIRWLVGDQKDDGGWVLHSPDISQRFYDAETWPTTEYLFVLSNEMKLYNLRSL